MVKVSFTTPKKIIIPDKVNPEDSEDSEASTDSHKSFERWKQNHKATLESQKEADAEAEALYGDDAYHKETDPQKVE